MITGVSSGIGKAMSEYFLGQGYTVFGTVRKPEDGDPLSQLSDHFHPLLADVTDEGQLQQASERLVGHLNGKPLTGIINNAGVGSVGPILLQPIEEIRQAIEVNYLGALLTARAFWPLLLGERPGRIVNISSISGGVTLPFLGAYAASKHALESLSLSLRRELQPTGVHSCLISPGFVKTQMADWSAMEQHLKTLYGETPWADGCKAFVQNAMKATEQAIPPEVVCKAAQHALESDNPKSRYVLDPLYHLGRHLDDADMDEILAQAVLAQ